MAAARDLSKVTARLGTDFDLRENTYKPFPCGIVNHPTIDGCIQLHREETLDPASIVAVRLRVAPLVMDLCNQQNITLGLQGKFSVYHGAAVGLVRGKAGLPEYTDDAVNEPLVKRVREATTAVGDPSVTEDQSRIEVELADGRCLSRFVEQSLGNIHRPLTDEQLAGKFRDQAVLVLPAADVDALIDMCWQIDELDDVGELVTLAIPAAARESRQPVGQGELS
jgi:2-methylcitrate dehydratase PrpD